MFNEFENQIWDTSSPQITITDNTDTSVDGESKKIVWIDGSDEEMSIAFDLVDLSNYEDISLYLYVRDTLEDGDIFKITIDSVDYIFNRNELRRNYWNHILFDCSVMGEVDEIKITSLIDNLILFIDYVGYRKVTYNMDVEIIKKIKNHIELDYNQQTTLSANVSSGSKNISLTSKAYITDTSVLKIDNGSGTIEEVELIDRNGSLKEPIINDFTSGNLVSIVCPVRGEDYDSVEPDPLCGVLVYDIDVDKQKTVVRHKGGTKIREYLGSLGILIYIDCSSKKKLHYMSRQFNREYGEEFQFLLDGEKVDIYLDNSIYNDGIIGSNPRMAYFYRLEPQPYLYTNTQKIDDLTINLESEPV
jgi:hypothetical protein